MHYFRSLINSNFQPPAHLPKISLSRTHNTSKLRHSNIITFHNLATSLLYLHHQDPRHITHAPSSLSSVAVLSLVGEYFPYNSTLSRHILWTLSTAVFVFTTGVLVAIGRGSCLAPTEECRTERSLAQILYSARRRIVRRCQRSSPRLGVAVVSLPSGTPPWPLQGYKIRLSHRRGIDTPHTRFYHHQLTIIHRTRPIDLYDTPCNQPPHHSPLCSSIPVACAESGRRSSILALRKTPAVKALYPSALSGGVSHHDPGFARIGVVPVWAPAG